MMAGILAAVGRSACCALVLLWFGAAVAGTAAAAPEGTTAADGMTPARQAGSEQLQYSPVTCPDISDGVCRTGCQVAICTALVNFYNATFNSTYSPWYKQRGWPELTATDCREQITDKQRGGLPGYCRAVGVDCCTSKEAEDDDCSVVGGVTELVLEVNGLNGSISNPQLLSGIAQLHACGLTKLILQGNDLSGSLSSDWGNFTRLTHLSVANTWISGTIPDSLRNLKGLHQLNLGTNFLRGPLPAWLSELQDLRELRLGANLGSNGDGTKGLNGTLPAALGQLTNLQVLDVQANALSGTLPRRLCSRSSQLQMVQLRNNRFSGMLDELSGCRSLTLLDVSGNSFQGQLPQHAAGNWSQLVVLDASRNHLHGPIPSSIYHLPMLAYLTLSHNSLSGTIGRDVSLLTYLTQLKLSHNYLTGEVDEGLWTLPQLQLADLSYNYFYGTLSRMSGLTLSLNQLNLENNSLVGPLPPNLGLLRNLDRVNIRKTNLSCVPLSTRPSRPPVARSPYTTLNGLNSTTTTQAVLDTVKDWAAADDSSSDDDLGPYLAATTQCSADQLLPCFLSFSEHTVPRTDNTSMACPAILRLPHDQAVAACNGSSSWQLGPLAYSVAETERVSEQTWDLDPSYYQFRKCVCLKGYSGTWSRNGTLLTCSPKSRDPLPTSLVMAIVAGAAGVLLLAAVGLLVWLRLAVQLRPRWRREKELNAHRKRGLPCGSPATIVVTDIEHYSTLMKLNAPLTTRALGLHNAVMRRAVATHAGHVVEQEGDSWTVAFHSPMDAVAFCLQAQQALARINWPAELVGTGTGSRLISGLSLALGGGGSSSLPLAAADTLSSMQPRASGPAAAAPGAAGRPTAALTGSPSTSWSSSIGSSSSSSPPESQTLPAAAAGGARDVVGGNHPPTVQQDTAVAVSPSASSPGQRQRDAAAAAAGGSCGLSSRRQQFLQMVLHHQPVSPRAAAALFDTAKQQQQQQQQTPALQCKEPSASSLTSLAGFSETSSLRSGRMSTGQQAVRPAAAAAASGAQVHEAGGGTGSKSMQIQEAPGLADPPGDTTGPGSSSTSTSSSSSSGGVLATLHSLRSRLTSRGGSKAGQPGGDQPADINRSSSCTISEVDSGLECLSGGDDGIIPALRGVAARNSHLARGNVGGSGIQQQQQSRFWSMIGLDRSYKGGNHGSTCGSAVHEHHQLPGLKEVPELMQGGLKVRMGVASGWVPRDTHICRCALMQLAKAVSDMANGGQVLLDGQCFVGIRDRLAELGTVDARGYNDKLWRDAAKAAVRQHTSGLLGCFSAVMRCVGRSSSGLNVFDSDALVLDMGAYFLPSLAPVIPNAAAALGDADDDAASFTAAAHLKAAQLAAAAVADVGNAAVAAAALALTAGGSSSISNSVGHGAVGHQLEHLLLSSSCAELSLYCVSARSLQCRVKLWGNKLSFKEDTQQTSRAYFQAPGALLAGFDPPSPVDPPPLPLVTLVFAEVEGGRALVRRRPELARLVHTTITRLTQVLLQALPEWCGVSDGYLCREQEGDLKFMLAFREPARAAEWCLMLQEVLLYVPWPQEVLDELAAVTAGSSSSSSPLEAWTGGADTNTTSNNSGSKDDTSRGGGSSSSACTGPAMRMGLSEGHPHSIMPDHLGRADYHGFHVNLAARLMGAAAQPGQVVTTVDVAERIFSTWRYEAEASVHRSTPHCKQHLRQVDDVPSPFVASQPGCSPTCDHLATHPAPEVPPEASAAAVHDAQQASGAVQGHDTALQASQSRPELHQHQQQQHLHPGQDSLPVCPGQCTYVGAAQHQVLQRGGSARPSLWALLDTTRSANLMSGPSYISRPVQVSCHHLGTYSFKGCGTVDVVTFLTDTIPVLEWPTADTKGAKGNLISAASGPVVGLQDCPVPLPAVLPVLRKAWRRTELLVQAASATKVQLLQQRNAAAAAAAAARGRPFEPVASLSACAAGPPAASGGNASAIELYAPGCRTTAAKCSSS